MKSLIPISKKIWEERKKYFENYLEYAEKVKRIARDLLGDDVKVLIFGSVVRGDWNANSDIDVLIVSKEFSSNWEENRWVRTHIKRSIGPLSPFQIHLASVEEYESWWRRFLEKNCVEV